MSKTRFFSSPPTLPQAQMGIVLIVGLVMVLLITIVSLAAVRGTGLQEAMAGNMRDRNIAFQAAESALRAGEGRVALNVTVLPNFSCAAGTGNCPYFAYQEGVGFRPQNAVEIWTEADWNARASVLDLALTDVAQQPRVVVEQMSEDAFACAANSGSAVGTYGAGAIGERCFPFRITARGFGASAGTVVIVQSSFMRKQ